MGARLRRSGKAGVVTTLVVIALLGSAWLAYATTAPKSGSYPTTQIRIKGKGFCGNKRAHTRFQFDASRKPDGRVQGRMEQQLGDASAGTLGARAIALTNTTNTADITFTGSVRGPRAKDSNTYTAQVHVTNDPDTYSITVRNASTGAVFYTQSCTVQGGGITFNKH